MRWHQSLSRIIRRETDGRNWRRQSPYWTEYVMYEGSERELRFRSRSVCPISRATEAHGLLVRGVRGAIWPIARRKKSKPSTRNAQRSRQPSGRCAKRDARTKYDRSSCSVAVHPRKLPLAESVAHRACACATPRRGGRALPVWFRFEMFCEWIDHALDDTLGRKWEARTNGTGIPPMYSVLDAG